MKINSIEISNFRKLASARVEFADETTILVGANNSGKTTAMTAMRRFLAPPKRFRTTDFTLAHWAEINAIGESWDKASAENTGAIPELAEWIHVLPYLDIWLDVEATELHYVTSVMPHLTWTGGLLGIRLRFEPFDLEAFFKDYVTSRRAISDVLAMAERHTGKKMSVKLWPKDMISFLEKRLNVHFKVRYYVLDPAKLRKPASGLAEPQLLDPTAEPVSGDPVSQLIRVDEIGAQRGFEDEPTGARGDGSAGLDSRKLASQLKPYYDDHLNPYDQPDHSDLAALEAIELANSAFDERLEECFSVCFTEISGLGYPGIFDPKIRISTAVAPMDGLSHDSAVQYEIKSAVPGQSLRLPESYNGLGYQNLVSIVFRLMSFRDAWMKKGKAGKKALEEGEVAIPPIHLVLVEEPEAHLHVQVQQVFIRQAYAVLRKHEDLLLSKIHKTHLVVSTHSSHVAHEAEFSSLRYFRRLPAGAALAVPTSEVIDLTNVFGNLDETRRFVTRYLTASHCDVLFADALILVEGAAERLMLPNFVKRDFSKINQSFVTWLEIGGSHAHRFKSLVEHLGLTTLVITDLDAGNAATKTAEPVRLGENQQSNNSTLAKWHPKTTAIDVLAAKTPAELVVQNGKFASIRVAYQQPISINVNEIAERAIANTFEDALMMANLEQFKKIKGIGLIAKFKTIAQSAKNAADLTQALYDELRGTKKKAEFALDMLEEENFDQLALPDYVRSGLDWLNKTLLANDVEVIALDIKQGNGEAV